MKKLSCLHLAVLAAICAAGTAHSASAASNDPKLRRGEVTKPIEALPSSTRLIVKYKGASADPRAAVRSAAARAGLTQRVSASASSIVTVEASQLRRMSGGAVVLRMSRKLQEAEVGKVLAELRADPSVEYAEVDSIMQPIRDLTKSGPAVAAATSVPTPNDPYYATHQWHLQAGPGGIDALSAWQSSTGAGLVVAVLDTGILPDHPDLKNGNHILPGYDFISEQAMSRRPTAGRAPGAQDFGDWREAGNECGLPAEDSSWHGTHVAGTVGELTHNGIGGAGVAYDAQVLPVRVLGRCGGYTSDIADAITWASGGHVDGVPDNTTPAEVLNLSLGGQGACSTATQTAIDGAVSRGAIVVVAAGNNSANAANFSPASCNNVITVGATGITGAKAFYSNYGAKVDISGPGGGGNQDTGHDGWDGFVVQTGSSSATTPEAGQYIYKGLAGTSMASPHVAAVVALVQSALVAKGESPLSAAEMESLLKRTASPFAVTPPSTQPIGTGILNAKLALDKALEEPCDPAATDCTPVSLPLTNGVVRSGTSGVDSGESLYAFTAVAGKALTFMTYGGNGNVKLYVKYGTEPTSNSFDAKSDRTGTSQTVRVPGPKAGIYYVKVVGGSNGFTGVSLQGRQ